MYEEKSKELYLAVLAADSYSLGTHWIYDTNELQALDIDWEKLNPPHTPWHQGKTKGDFTHYGDQLLILNNFIKDKKSFDIRAYMSFWRESMKNFKGYLDGATKETLLNLDKNIQVPCGSTSHDMSVVGKITPLLPLSNSREEFLQNSVTLAKATHNDKDVLEVTDFFAKVLLDVLEGTSIKKSIQNHKENSSKEMHTLINRAIASSDQNTLQAIATFGPACPTLSAFPSTIHLLFKYDNLKEALIANSKAGGDSSARAMVVAYLFTAQESLSSIPDDWLKFNAQ